MSNERLRSQIAAAGMTITDLAGTLDVDPKTIERWITKDRMPYRRHRWATAEALKVDEGYLWPQVLDDPQTKSASQAEFVTLYPHRGAIPSDLWTRLIAEAQDSIDVLVYSGLFLLDGQPDLLSNLVEKAGRGTKARLLLGEPDSAAVQLRAQEEGIGENMTARSKLSLDVLRPTLGTPGIEVRTHDHDALQLDLPLRRASPGQHPRVRLPGAAEPGDAPAPRPRWTAVRPLHAVLRPRVGHRHRRTPVVAG